MSCADVDDPRRQVGAEREEEAAPEPRTHAGYLENGRASENWQGAQNRRPAKEHGVNEVSPLLFYPLFDLVWDILPDMMHILPGVWKRHLFALLVGKRTPKKPKPRMYWTEEDNKELEKDYRDVLKHLESWKLSKDDQVSMCIRHPVHNPAFACRQSVHPNTTFVILCTILLLHVDSLFIQTPHS